MSGLPLPLPPPPIMAAIIAPMSGLPLPPPPIIFPIIAAAAFVAAHAEICEPNR